MKDLAQLLYSTEIPGDRRARPAVLLAELPRPGAAAAGRPLAGAAGAVQVGALPQAQHAPEGARGVCGTGERSKANARGGRGRNAMNIAFCYDSVLPSRGGCETYIASLARRLAVDGHEVHVYARRWDASALPASTHYHPITLPSCPRFLRPWFFAAACRRALAAGQAPGRRSASTRLPGLDVLYPQGGLYAATAEHNLLKYRSPLLRRLLRVCKAFDPAHLSFMALERRQYLGGRGR